MRYTCIHSYVCALSTWRVRHRSSIEQRNFTQQDYLSLTHKMRAYMYTVGMQRRAERISRWIFRYKHAWFVVIKLPCALLSVDLRAMASLETPVSCIRHFAGIFLRIVDSNKHSICAWMQVFVRMREYQDSSCTLKAMPHIMKAFDWSARKNIYVAYQVERCDVVARVDRSLVRSLRSTEVPSGKLARMAGGIYLYVCMCVCIYIYTHTLGVSILCLYFEKHADSRIQSPWRVLFYFLCVCVCVCVCVLVFFLWDFLAVISVMCLHTKTRVHWWMSVCDSILRHLHDHIKQNYHRKVWR